MHRIVSPESLKYKRYVYEKEGFIIHALTSGERTFFTNAFIIETDNALVVVDTMMIISDAALLRAFADKLAKPIIAIIITHGHPDHYNGSHTVIDAQKIPIISTQGVKDCIKETVDSKETKWKGYFGEDWPEFKLLPTQIVNDGDSLILDSLELCFTDLGAAESSSDLYFTIGQQRSAVFVGDVVFNKMHGFMNDGNSHQWLQVLGQLLTEIADVKQLFTGHGDAANSKSLIQTQIDYIVDYRSTLLKLIDQNQALSDAQKQQFEQDLIEKYPQYQLVGFIQAGIDAVSQELMLEKLATV